MSQLLKDLKAKYITPETAKEYAETTDKIAYCSDITGLSIDSNLLFVFEVYLERLAIELGYLPSDEPETETIGECDALERYDEMLDECNEVVIVCGYEYAPSDALKRLDPIAYNVGFSDYCSMLESEHGIIVE